MLKKPKESRPLFWFYILTIYVIIQFIWWSYYMATLNYEIYNLRSELNVLKGESLNDVVINGNTLNTKLHARWIMIAGEGTVFIGFLLIGIFQIRKTFKKEATLALQQKNFLLSVTHELKSPIASAKLQLQTLQKHTLPKEKQNEIIANAINDTDRLNNLVENILLAAKIDNDIYTFNKQEINLSEYLTEGINQTIESFNYKHNIKLDIEPNLMMEIDKISFPSIFLNIFENAVKYSPDNSTIAIQLKRLNDKIVLSIVDEGIGIADEEKEKVFQKFYRIGSEETRKTKGTGLGLYIVNYLVKQHNGAIVIRNNFPKGTIFEITFELI